ncbi:IclR family transcriptional regulator [Paracoccus sp. S1E-3]|uniref:IclR family transcriptional regulator n=1 Tax=Paracoccus sp. S1E-3 TaxID=2756130 RepID=UPI0015EFB5C1|nr:IclR family transcriptional regulator [Paracoccus sp. S1E-3]MBA4491472.1 IclR family transcriptional regulator [Paracoccus sp. S1E-3]
MSKSNPLDRAFRILDIVASSGREMSLVEIVNAARLPQSSTFRLAANLAESGMLKFDPGTKTYSVGSRARRLSMFISREKSLRVVLVPVLEALAYEAGETSFYVSASENGNQLLEFVVPNKGANAFIHPGFEFPVHATAAGKVIQAFSEDPAPRPDAHLQAYQPHTIVDPKRLSQLYAEIRKSGFAINDSELDKDVFSVCVPVLIGNLVAGALGLVGPSSRIGAEKPEVDLLVEKLQASAAEIATLVA